MCAAFPKQQSLFPPSRVQRHARRLNPARSLRGRSSNLVASFTKPGGLISFTILTYSSPIILSSLFISEFNNASLHLSSSTKLLTPTLSSPDEFFDNKHQKKINQNQYLILKSIFLYPYFYFLFSPLFRICNVNAMKNNGTAASDGRLYLLWMLVMPVSIQV